YKLIDKNTGIMTEYKSGNFLKLIFAQHSQTVRNKTFANHTHGNCLAVQYFPGIAFKRIRLDSVTHGMTEIQNLSSSRFKRVTAYNFILDFYGSENGFIETFKLKKADFLKLFPIRFIANKSVFYHFRKPA